MKNIKDDIITYLTFVQKKDTFKGGNGWRTTAEIAAHLQSNTAKVRRHLKALVNDDLVVCTDSDGLFGNMLLWRINLVHTD